MTRFCRRICSALLMTLLIWGQAAVFVCQTLCTHTPAAAAKTRTADGGHAQHCARPTSEAAGNPLDAIVEVSATSSCCAVLLQAQTPAITLRAEARVVASPQLATPVSVDSPTFSGGESASVAPGAPPGNVPFAGTALVLRL